MSDCLRCEARTAIIQRKNCERVWRIYVGRDSPLMWHAKLLVSRMRAHVTLHLALPALLHTGYSFITLIKTEYLQICRKHASMWIKPCKIKIPKNPRLFTEWTRGENLTTITENNNSMRKEIISDDSVQRVQRYSAMFRFNPLILTKFFIVSHSSVNTVRKATEMCWIFIQAYILIY